MCRERYGGRRSEVGGYDEVGVVGVAVPRVKTTSQYILYTHTLSLSLHCIPTVSQYIYITLSLSLSPPYPSTTWYVIFERGGEIIAGAMETRVLEGKGHYERSATRALLRTREHFLHLPLTPVLINFVCV